MAAHPGRFASASNSLSRRHFLTAVAGSVLLGACADTAPNNRAEPETNTAGQGAAQFRQPEVLRSENGRLDVTLTAAPGTFQGAIGGALAYNGAPVGPTLLIRPGDRLGVTLRNDLDAPTNLHTHGLNVSPVGQGDDVFATIGAGEERSYVYDVPADHPSGTFWYHPHLHGSVAAQVAAGLFGAIIVEDEVDDRADMAAMTERLFVLNDPIGIGREASPMDGMHGRTGEAVRVNGVVQPVIASVAGGLERWRVVNASATRPLSVSVPGVVLHLIASDGGRLSSTRSLDGLVLVPGERAEVIVEIPSAVEELAIGSDGAGQPLAVLAPTVGQSTELPTTGGTLEVPDGLGESVSVGAELVVRERTLTLGVDMGMGSMMYGDSGLEFTIDGIAFDPQRTDITVEAGTVEEWRIVNATGMDHPFHLHAWPFSVVGDDAWPGWKDTVNVPGSGEVVIRIPFVGRTGRTVYHCHILDHEDLGMMGVVDVQPA
ncbi:MAG: multicopper oxidase family protein [Ilumatobacter sp.]|uniref:multicopper oxidase family protein n=1 Tax=Ilumatobacter sp. TaxID=1967498 RepID=UPI00391BD0F2